MGIFSPHFRLEELEGVFFDEEKRCFDSLKASGFTIPGAVLFYPGAGVDFAHTAKLTDLCSSADITWVIADLQDYSIPFCRGFSRITGGTRYKLKDRKDRKEAVFRFRDRRVRFVFFVNDVNKSLPSILDKGFNSYFERAFEICREAGFMEQVIKMIDDGGLLITDAGRLEREGLEEVMIPEETRKLGFYKNFTVYRKIAP